MMKQRKTEREREGVCVCNDAVKFYEYITPMVSACNINKE